MKPRKRLRVSLILILTGVMLILASAGILLYTQLSGFSEVKNLQAITEKAERLMPALQDRVPEERGNNIMGSMEIDGINIIGLIEVPKYSSKLPVRSAWSTSAAATMPCRFTGSIYDCSLIIGTSDEEGLWSFAGELEINDRLILTDMEGGRYSYSVSEIDHSDNADLETVQSDDADLTIFVKLSLSMEYIIIHCKVK